MVAGCCWDVAVDPADVDGCWDVAVDTLASCLPGTFACYPIGARLSQLVGFPGREKATSLGGEGGVQHLGCPGRVNYQASSR